MANFYKIQYSDFRYMLLGLDQLDIMRNAPRDIGLEFDDIMLFSERDTRMASWWYEPEVSFTPNYVSGEPLIPDVVIWQAGAALVLGPVAYRILGGWLKQYGELLPVTVLNEPEKYWIFNCIAKKNADPDGSSWEYSGNLPTKIKSIGFTCEDSDPAVFKTDFDNYSFLYCGGIFKDSVEAHGLKGVDFIPL